MGKKFTTLISTLTLAASSLAATISPPPAFATGESEISLDDYWSFSEILELKTELDTAAKESCEDDYTCEREYIRQEILSHYKEDPRYDLIDRINESNFEITAIDPTNETVTIYYNDEDTMEWEFTGAVEHCYLKELYLAWADKGYPDMRNSRVSFNDGTRNRTAPIYVANANTGSTTDGVHQVFAHTISDGEPTWLEYNKENVLDVAGSNLVDDTTGMLYFSVYSYGSFSAIGAISYSNFMSSWEPGMVYKLMYSKENTYEYWVPQRVGSSNETEESTTDTDSTEPTTSPTEPVEEPGEDPKPTADANKSTITFSIKKISTSDIGVPTTSKSASRSAVNSISDEEKQAEVLNNITEVKPDENNVDLPASGNIETKSPTEAEHVFPWWIIAFVFSGIVLTLWWFIPAKKFEKGVDKK